MSTAWLRTILAAAACAAVVTFAMPSSAEMMQMKADLKGSNEVPPNDSKGGGSVELTYDTASKKLSWNGTYTGLSGPATAAHFHSGEPGKNGGVAVPIFTGDKAQSPFSGSATLTDEQAAALMDGKFYVNIHTAAHKAGELRGQVTK